MADEQKMVQVPEGKLNELLARLQNLERGVTTTRPKRVTQHTAYLRTHEGNFVVDFKPVRTTVNRDTKEQTLDWDIIVQDGAELKTVTVDYLTFLNEPNSIKVLIKSQLAKPRVEVNGYIMSSPTDPVNAKAFTSQEVPLEVTSVDYDVTVEVLEGDNKGTELTVPQKALNI